MPRPVLGNYDGAVVSGFFVFGARSVQWVSATVDCKCFENTASCEADLVPPPTTQPYSTR